MQSTPFRQRFVFLSLLSVFAWLLVAAWGTSTWAASGFWTRLCFIVVLAALTVGHVVVLGIAKRLRVGFRQLNDATTGTTERSLIGEDVVTEPEFVPLATTLASWESDRISQVQDLHAANQRFETLLESMQEGVAAVDDSSVILFANDASRRLLEFSDEKVVGRSLFHVTRSKPLHDLIADAFESEDAVEGEIELVGVARRMLAVRATLLPGQESIGVLLVLHDITELRRLENMREELAANVGHELKTPLASIKAYAETLLNGAINDPKYNLQFVGRIEEQANRLNELIHDLMQIARIESNEEVFELVDICVQDVLRSTVVTHEAEASSLQITLAHELPAADFNVHADREGLRTIVENLVTNAIKYTPEEGRIVLRSFVESGQAIIEVEDSGVGIPEEHHSRIFERFYRVDGARSRDLGGTGLGLAIVKHLAQAFGGAVSLSSQEGEGSCFRVSLPVKTNDVQLTE